jgi:hypothetical protein
MSLMSGAVVFTVPIALKKSGPPTTSRRNCGMGMMVRLHGG